MTAINEQREEAQTDIASPSLAIGITICFLGALFYCYEYLLRIQPSVMFTELRTQFDLTGQSLGILGGLYYMAYSPMQVGVGLLTDMFGPRKMLTMAVVVCTLGSFIFGYTDNLYIAGVGRFLIGFGSAFAFVGVLKLAAIWLPPSWFALSAGMATALGMIGALVGGIELTSLVKNIGWRETIYWSTVVGAVLTPLIWFMVRDTHRGQPKSEEGVTLKQGLRGMIEIAKNPQMWITGYVGLTLFLSLSVFAEQFGIEYLYNVHHFTMDRAATANSMIFFGWLIGAPLIGLVSDRVNRRQWPIVIGLITACLTILAVIFIPEAYSKMIVLRVLSFDVYLIDILLFLFGLFCSAEIICFAIGREQCPDHMSASAVSFINMLVMLGGALFQPLFGWILDVSAKLSSEHTQAFFSPHAYRVALMIIPVSLVLGLIASYFMQDHPNRVRHG